MIKKPQMKINVLPPSVYNLLSAGEVVEGPSSIVKECVENSLDAGATMLEVEIERGGLGRIKIVDNGHGITATEVEKVFAPHATSKINTASDLDGILTLGFRGEAMSSIAAVSRVDLLTQSKDEGVGTRLSVAGGEIVSKESASANAGTQITISNLFYNTPARRKFLKSEAVERNAVSALVSRLILANPNISWKYVVDGEIIHAHNGDGLKPAISTIYGLEVLPNLLAVDFKSGGMRAHGFMSRPSFTKRSRTYQTTIINGRVVEGGAVAAAINGFFNSYMTTGNFPFYVLALEINPESVDVNIHPRKAQVKFEDQEAIQSFVEAAVGAALDAHFDSNPTPTFALSSDEQMHDDTLRNMKYLATASSDSFQELPNLIDKLTPESKKSETVVEPKKLPSTARGSSYSGGFSGRTKQDVIKTTQESFEANRTEEVFVQITQLFSTYMMVSDHENLYIIDQHAAAERILFDELRAQIDSGAPVSQQLLVPVQIFINAEESTKLDGVLSTLEAMGFRLDTSAKRFVRITAVPITLVTHRGNIEAIVSDVLSELKKSGKEKLSDMLEDRIIKICCHASLRGNRKLSGDQVQMFLANFRETGVPKSCPHGRPVMVVLSRSDVEKMFSRK